MLDNFRMMKRLKAISFYECTRSGMKAAAVDPSSDVSCARVSFKSAAFILELCHISIQGGGGEVHRVCSLALCIPTGRSASTQSRNGFSAFDLPVSHFMLSPWTET